MGQSVPVTTTGPVEYPEGTGHLGRELTPLSPSESTPGELGPVFEHPWATRHPSAGLFPLCCQLRAMPDPELVGVCEHNRRRY